MSTLRQRQDRLKPFPGTQRSHFGSALLRSIASPSPFRSRAFTKRDRNDYNYQDHSSNSIRIEETENNYCSCLFTILSFIFGTINGLYLDRSILIQLPFLMVDALTLSFYWLQIKQGMEYGNWIRIISFALLLVTQGFHASYLGMATVRTILGNDESLDNDVNKYEKMRNRNHLDLNQAFMNEMNHSSANSMNNFASMRSSQFNKSRFTSMNPMKVIGKPETNKLKLTSNYNSKNDAFDLNSSPKRLASLDPLKPVDQESLDRYLDRHKKKAKNGYINLSETVLITPEQYLRQKTNTSQTPIGKAFNTMQFTPSSNINQVQLLNTPSTIDISMASVKDDLFAVPNDLQSDFNAMNVSMVANPSATPAVFGKKTKFRNGNILSEINENSSKSKKEYNYDSFYNGIQLTGDNMGCVVEKKTPDLSLLNVQGSRFSSSMRPISPFCRRSMNSNDSDIVSNLKRKENNKLTIMFQQKAVLLYKSLEITDVIIDWTENMRWWLSENVLRARFSNMQKNADRIEQLIFMLRQQFPNIRPQLDRLCSPQSRQAFVLSNQDQLTMIAQQRNCPQIISILQQRKHINECIALISPNQANSFVNDYILARMQSLSQNSNNLHNFEWNRGADHNEQTWQPFLHPTDSHLLMALFCKYMDDIMCPAVVFSKKHYFEVDRNGFKKLDKYYQSWKFNQFDVAIICVKNNKNGNNSNNGNKSNNKNKNDDCFPYYFVAFDKEKFDVRFRKRGVRKPKHYLGNQGYAPFDDDEDDSDQVSDIDQLLNESDQFRRKKKANRVGQWYPQPGKNNLFHTLILFALFLHRYSNDKLNGISLKDQGCNLVEPILQ